MVAMTGMRESPDRSIPWQRRLRRCVPIPGLLLSVVLVLGVGACCLFGLAGSSLVFVLHGPHAARLVSVAGEHWNERLPHRVRRETEGLVDDEGLFACEVVVADGDQQMRGRMRGIPSHSFKTGCQAILRAAESMDGSAWLLSDWNDVEVRPALDDACWFVYQLWGSQELVIDGIGQPNQRGGIARVSAKPPKGSIVQARGWSAEVVAEPGTCVHVLEWGSDLPGFRIECDDSGFDAGTVSVDDGPPVALVTDRMTAAAEGSTCRVLLTSETGRAASVTMNLLRRGHLTLRVTRDR